VQTILREVLKAEIESKCHFFNEEYEGTIDHFTSGCHIVAKKWLHNST
jgi:hypothetical protein